ncbi:DNA polymerase/3'-5' exonuclease PolX [Haloplanus aerogenes]|uniref:DNA polymerase beta n=1 Tax=Haloplanus aerogenes TaxID=660522 RepID=A0A3M0D4F7_9EURY|nr:DNA polymerase/3'-5' exonuclease PolX [Haloplanus aerogenes]AZH24922.1 DNA polymerase/3'-5' exonuclease PolX [Haloplanus aerogenes]RMB13866.1 DNA polymerase (family 10) [Haloplanus aerogenes]
MSRNAEVAARFEEMADLLEAQDVEYKPRSYRRAAENIREHPTPIEDLAAEGKAAVEEIDGVGDALASKVVEYVETGEIEELEDLRDQLPVDMAALTSVEGVGPKTVGTLYEALGITTLDELEAAARDGEIREVSGFGAKTESNILENIPFARQAQERELLGDARPVAEELLDYLRAADPVERADVAGSLRRWRETIGDVDVLVASSTGEAAVDAFLDWAAVDERIESGTTKASVRARDMRVDLRVVVPEEFGSALQYFTGSKDHNVHLRNLAIDRDLKMNEYGVFDVSEVEDADEAGQRAGRRIGGETEAEMYDALDLPLVPPELREDRGEIEAAQAGELPDLLEAGELRGDLHTHTDWSDGGESIETMIAGADERGDDYICISDHATGPGMVGGVGLDDGELREQMDAVAEAAADADIDVFHGVEANIDADGGLSVGDDVLAELDIVIASPHSGLDADREVATDRLVAAVEHPETDILGHPTGRLINDRPGLAPDMDRLAVAAADAKTALEVNANPHRLDLNDEAVRTAVEAGATIAINTDAHGTGELPLRRYGVHTARRGWAETGEVLNTRSAADVRSWLE